MARESAADKALRYIREERVHVLSANEFGVRYEVRGSSREPYLCAYGIDRRGKRVTSCSCFNGTEIHPVRPNCSHVAVGRLLFRR